MKGSLKISDSDPSRQSPWWPLDSWTTQQLGASGHVVQVGEHETAGLLLMLGKVVHFWNLTCIPKIASMRCQKYFSWYHWAIGHVIVHFFSAEFFLPWCKAPPIFQPSQEDRFDRGVSFSFLLSFLAMPGSIFGRDARYSQYLTAGIYDDGPGRAKPTPFLGQVPFSSCNVMMLWYGFLRTPL